MTYQRWHTILMDLRSISKVFSNLGEWQVNSNWGEHSVSAIIEGEEEHRPIAEYIHEHSVAQFLVLGHAFLPEIISMLEWYGIDQYSLYDFNDLVMNTSVAHKGLMFSVDGVTVDKETGHLIYDLTDIHGEHLWQVDQIEIEKDYEKVR